MLRVIACLLLLLGAALSAETGAAPREAIDLIAEGMLDDQVDLARRTALSTELTQKADAGDSFAQLVLGSLYRQGPAHPANVLPLDINRARGYLSMAAQGGWLQAMSALAELELEHGATLDAMLWTQVYSHYLKSAVGEQHFAFSTVRVADGYVAELLDRVYRQLPKTDRDSIQPLTVAFLEKFGPSIEAARAKMKPVGSADLKVAPVSRNRHLPKPRSNRLIRSSTALYVVEIGKDGGTTRDWVIDAYPDRDVLAYFRTYVKETRFNAGQDDQGRAQRLALYPIAYDNNKFSRRAAK